jgi:L-malate glycosyltransferase
VRFVLTYSADAVVAVSRYTARRFNDGLDRSVATHVYNGLDTDGLRPDPGAPASVREELGITADAALLGQVSQITPWKGQDTAIRALAELRRGGVDAHLLLVGEVRFAGKAVRYDNHEYLRSLHRLVTELGVDGAVHFLGQRDDVARILSAIDISLLPSSHEPFGRVVLESMAVETPPLVSEAGAGPELVEDGVSGRLLPADRPELWAAAARELLDDPAARTRMGRSGREAVGRFTDDAQVRGILAVYERALGWREPAGANGSAREAEKPAEVAAWRG